MFEQRTRLKNPLVLAFVGDAVQTLFVREKLAEKDAKVSVLHRQASGFVCARAQAKLYDEFSDKFTDTEKEIAARARNQTHTNLPKNCDPADYNKATALEAVIGYNYLTNNTARIKKILEN